MRSNVLAFVAAIVLTVAPCCAAEKTQPTESKEQAAVSKADSVKVNVKDASKTATIKAEPAKAEAAGNIPKVEPTNSAAGASDKLKADATKAYGSKTDATKADVTSANAIKAEGINAPVSSKDGVKASASEASVEPANDVKTKSSKEAGKTKN